MSQFCRDLATQIILSPSFVAAMTDMMAVEIERQLRGIAGGDTLYIPKTTSRDDIEARNAIIRAQFNGRNIDDLARRFALTARQIRRIVRARSDRIAQLSKLR